PFRGDVGGAAETRRVDHPAVPPLRSHSALPDQAADQGPDRGFAPARLAEERLDLVEPGGAALPEHGHDAAFGFRDPRDSLSRHLGLRPRRRGSWLRCAARRPPPRSTPAGPATPRDWLRRSRAPGWLGWASAERWRYQ